MPRIAWEDNILGFIPKTDWLEVPFQVTRPNDPADMLFGDQRTDNLVAEWESIAAQYQIPVMAQFHGFDTESQQTFRVPVDHRNIEKGLIKVKINQSERMRALTRSGVQDDTALYDYVMNDGLRLADQVVTRTKVAKNEILATGNITIHENNLDLTVDYGVPDANKNLALDFGEGAEKSIPAQIQDIVDRASAEGSIISGIYTSRAMIGKLRNDRDIQMLINGTSAVGAMVRQSALADYLAEEFGINQIITNDLTYGASAVIDSATNRPSVTSKRYFPKDKVTFFANNPGSGRLGIGLWGDPPETDVTQLLQVSGSTVSPYVYITQWAEKDPAVLWTKASTLFMPVLYNPYSLYIATATDSGAGGATGATGA